jgi:hypothetical protein
VRGGPGGCARRARVEMASLAGGGGSPAARQWHAGDGGMVNPKPKLWYHVTNDQLNLLRCPKKQIW